MFEVIKYGQDKKGFFWVVGHYKENKLDFFEIFNTNVNNEEFFKTGKELPVKKFKISKSRDGKYRFYLEF